MATFKICFLGLLLWTLSIPTPAAEWPPPGRPAPVLEAGAWDLEPTELDQVFMDGLQAAGVQPANPCAEQIFLRRVYLDLTGTLPTPEQWLTFVQSHEPDKRRRVVEELLQSREFALYQTMQWCNLLRVKAEFPVKLWPNAVQAYHRWIFQAMRDNMPLDVFARKMLTSSGSNFRVPPVNFYRAVQVREPAGLAEAVALTWMGTRLSRWPEARRRQVATFFSRVAYKKTTEWKEEIVCLDPAQSDTPLLATLPDGKTVTIPAGEDPRRIFADWLLAPDNPWFARNLVNRTWAHLLGRGLIHEPDDIHDGNSPSHPAVLRYLEQKLRADKYDLRALYRTIILSRAYQQSCLPRATAEPAERLHAAYGVRRLEAEVLADALAWLTSYREELSSPIPEPFTWIPLDQRAIELADGSITNSFLELFGKPPRDTGLWSERPAGFTDAQRLYLLNDNDLLNKLQYWGRIPGCVTWAQGDTGKLIAALYVNILSRAPTAEESAAALKYFQDQRLLPARQAADLAWALINSREFLFRH